VDWNKFYQPASPVQKEQTGLLADTFIFGTVSCFKPQKNLLDLLKAFKHMHDQLSLANQERVLLQLVGDGVQRPLIEQWIKENNMQNTIDLLGWQSDVAQWMKSWNVFMMSSLWEGLPCAIIEARLCNLPVISYKISGVPEVIKNKQNGFLVKTGKWKLLGNRMKEIFENPELLQKMSNYNDNLTDFKDMVMIEKHAKLYNQLL